MSMVQQAIEVGAPVHTVYEQLIAFENYPRFMTGVQRVTPIGPGQTHWVMEVDGRRREFDAAFTERSLDERVSWESVDGPRMAETITVRPLGETKTQVIAQLEADVAFLLPSDRHGQATLTKRLRSDLAAFKGMVESTAPVAGTPMVTGASSKRLSRHSQARLGTTVDITTAPGIRSEHDLDDILAPGTRISRTPPTGGVQRGGAPMGGRTPAKDGWGDGMINEEDRGSAGF